MVGTLLVRGMLVGLLAGLLSFGFLKIVGEPLGRSRHRLRGVVDDAKAQAKVEEAAAKGSTAPKEETGPELVSREVQGGVGLLTGVSVYSAAFGGLFALVFALGLWPRGRFRPAGHRRPCWRRLGSSAYYVDFQTSSIPPPAVGRPARYHRHAHNLYFVMILISLGVDDRGGRAAASLPAPLWGLERGPDRRRHLSRRDGQALSSFLRGVDEAPDGFPATARRRFRIASLGGATDHVGDFGIDVWRRRGTAFEGSAAVVAFGGALKTIARPMQLRGDASKR